MVFQIQFSRPDRQTVSVQPLLQKMKELLHMGLAYGRAFRHTPLQPPALLQHLLRRASPSVTVAVTGQHITTYVLILVALPRSHNLAGVLPAVISRRERRFLSSFPFRPIIPRGDQIRQHFASVDSPPQEGIVWKLIVLVPAQLRRHKVRKA